MNDKFDLEKQYQIYLSRVALSEKIMHPERKITLKGVEITMERFIELLETLQP